MKRYTILILSLLTVAFFAWPFLEGYSKRPAGDFETEMGSNRLQDGLYQEAITYFDEALLIEPTHRGAMMGRAIAFLQMGEEEKALTALDELIAFLRDTLSEDDKTGKGVLAAAFANRGITHDRRGEHHKALEDYIQSLVIDREAVSGPGLIDKVLYGDERLSTVQTRARYLHEQFQLPEADRLLSIPVLDGEQRMYKP